jgi:hypothetical protein
MNLTKDKDLLSALVAAALAAITGLATIIRSLFKLFSTVRSNTKRIELLEKDVSGLHKTDKETQRILGLIEVKLSELAAYRLGDEGRFADLKYEVTAQGDRLEARINRLEKDHF